MKDTAPISLGIIAVAAAFGIIAAGVAFVLFKFGLAGSVMIGILVGLITAVVLMLGWREPAGSLQDATPPASAAPEEPTQAPVAATTPEPTAPFVADAPVEPAPAEETPAPEAPVAEEPVAEEHVTEKAPAAEEKTAEVPAPATAAADTPEFLSAAREGGPDDLKQIKGVGPKLEKTLHDMGIFHFDQISGWGPAEQAWMDENLAGFKGRATRDNWVEQAKTLAAGGTTEFSSKVKKGNVY